MYADVCAHMYMCVSFVCTCVCVKACVYVLLKTRRSFRTLYMYVDR